MKKKCYALFVTLLVFVVVGIVLSSCNNKSSVPVETNAEETNEENANSEPQQQNNDAEGENEPQSNEQQGEQDGEQEGEQDGEQDGEEQEPEEVKTYTVTAEQFAAAIKSEVFNNFTVIVKATSDGVLTEKEFKYKDNSFMEIRINGEKKTYAQYVKTSYGTTKVYTYGQKKQGNEKEWYYDYSQPEKDGLTSSEEYVKTCFFETFDGYEYDEETNSYVAKDVKKEDISEYKERRLYFENGELVRIYIVENLTYLNDNEVEERHTRVTDMYYSDFGKTEIEIPDGLRTLLNAQ